MLVKNILIDSLSTPLTSATIMLMASTRSRSMPPQNPATPGQRLKAMRLAAGLTQEELAEILGWEQSKISKVEKDAQQVTLTEAEAWAGACAASPQMAMPKTTKKLRRPVNTKADTVIEPDVVHPLVQASLDRYIERKRREITDVEVERLPYFARGVNPFDPNIKVDDHLWDAFINLIRATYRGEN